ncbi:MAG: NYN domain-containing protein [Chloroflexi bacterium]|nr:NYN domain-containing protein [Chloroflexota bacterium]
MPYLIDGHNLIASLPGSSLDDPDDEAKLVIRLRGFVARRRNQCTVVFDGGLPGGFSAMSNKSVKVIFAADQRSSADRVIQRRIRRTPDPANWTLVSSDNELRQVASSRGMRQMKSAEFARLMQSGGSDLAEPGEEINPVIPDDELDHWLRVFGADGEGEPDDENS